VSDEPARSSAGQW